MAQSTVYANIRSYAKTIDWKLLIFLLLFMHVKLVVKAIALIFIYLMRPNFKFGFQLKNSRLPLFYLAVIGIAVFNWVISNALLNISYLLVVATGIAFWMACILAMHQLKLSVEINEPATLHRTLLIFFVINVLASYAIYAGIVWETGTINPFRYQGNFQKYFMGTGDYIKGISFDTSTTNAVINAFGVLYFLNRQRFGLMMLCMFTLLLTGSNVTNLLLCGIFIGLFILSSNKNQKSAIVICCMLGVIFMVKISPQNNQYIKEAYNKILGKNRRVPIAKPAIPAMPGSEVELSPEERKRQIARNYIDSMDRLMLQQATPDLAVVGKPDTLLVQKLRVSIPTDNIHTPAFQYKNDTTEQQKKLLDFSAKQPVVLPLANKAQPPSRLPGKLIGLQQTVRFFQQHPRKLITGTGVGNFSSKLAFRATAMKIAGGYPAQFAYINPVFESNHFDLYLSYFTRQDKLHSLVNSPNSTYDQLLAEYGLTGLAAFLFFYLGFFAKHWRKLSYGIPLLVFTAGIFFVEYWFEQLSILVLFELMLLLNIKEGSAATTSL